MGAWDRNVTAFVAVVKLLSDVNELVMDNCNISERGNTGCCAMEGGGNGATATKSVRYSAAQQHQCILP